MTKEETKIKIDFEDEPKSKKIKTTKRKPKKKNHIQGIRKKYTSFHKSPDSSSKTLDAQDLLNESKDDDNIQLAEDLINDAEILIQKEKNKETNETDNNKRDDKKEIKKEVISDYCFEDKLKKCPLCSSKIIKGKVTQFNNTYTQTIKCKKCLFERNYKCQL